MKEDISKLLVFIAVSFALVSAGAVLLPRLVASAAGPEADILTQLKVVERVGLDIELPGGALRGLQVQYQRLSVVVDPGQERAVVTGTLDFTGKFADTQVSSLGLERIELRHRDGSWTPVDGYAPRLVGVVLALERRRLGLQAGSLLPEASEDPEVRRWRALTRRKLTARAWFIRSERDEVTVSEDYRLEGNSPERPVDELGTKRLTLKLDARGQFFFPNGLM